MMMIHPRQHHPHHHPATVEIPPWDSSYDDPAAVGSPRHLFSPQTNDYFTALSRYLPSSNEFDSDEDTEFDSFSCDEFRMYEFKIRKCARGRSHDWTECPYAHPGEKARRRDPRRYHYSGAACPEFRRGNCRKGDSCEYAHGVFECWLHPARYRTQPCKDGPHCKRRVCFFAHSPDQLRILPAHSPDPPDSPPMSPRGPSPDLIAAMRGLKVGTGAGVGAGTGAHTAMSPRSPWGAPIYGSPSPSPSPRTQARSSGLGLFDPWEFSVEEDPPMERVESGKDLRARIYSKLSKENSLDRDRVDSTSAGPDFGWVSELVK